MPNLVFECAGQRSARWCVVLELEASSTLHLRRGGAVATTIRRVARLDNALGEKVGRLLGRVTEGGQDGHRVAAQFRWGTKFLAWRSLGLDGGAQGEKIL